MTPIDQLADQALFIASSHVGAGPDISGRFRRALSMHTNGDNAVLRAAVMAIAEAGYSFDDFEGEDAWSIRKRGVKRATTYFKN